VLLSQHFVAAGLLPADRYRDLIDLEALREAADYQSAVFALTARHVRPDLERARQFIAEARALLGQRGLVA
jgi:hypothetical protein